MTNETEHAGIKILNIIWGLPIGFLVLVTAWLIIGDDVNSVPQDAQGAVGDGIWMMFRFGAMVVGIILALMILLIWKFSERGITKFIKLLLVICVITIIINAFYVFAT